jgi:two-component system chemotaxis response regulator CheB
LTATKHSTRILICEDSHAYAASLAKFLQHDGTIDVVAMCETAEQALRSLPRVKPDLVTMDLELPGMNGVEAIKRIMSSNPTPTVVLSAYAERGSERAAAALAAGALDTLPKDQLRLSEMEGPHAVALRRRLSRLARARVENVARMRPRTPSARFEQRAVSAIGICASTGGPRALETVLRELPQSFPLPILIVQHMASGFTDGLTSWLDSQLPLSVQTAKAGQTATPGIWFAPEGAHLVLGAELTMELDFETAVGPHRPCADILFRSMATTLGPRAAVVVLTGMGHDGAQGVAAVRAAGGLVVAQDEATSAVFGMPRAAAEHAHHVFPLEQIATALLSLRAATDEH